MHAWLLLAFAMTPAEVDRLLAEGRALAANPLQRVEQRLAANPDDVAARIQLLASYTENAATAGLERAREERARQILWLLQYDPGNPVLLHRTGVGQLHCEGDELADPASFAKARDFWLRHSDPAAAARALQYCAPADALNRSADPAIYAAVALGLTGLDYANEDPAGSSARLREAPPAVAARQWLEEKADARGVFLFLSWAARLRAAERLDWDYSTYGTQLLEKARAAHSEAVELWAVTGAPPPAGETPVAVLFPDPAAFRRQALENPGVAGPARLRLLISPEGKVERVGILAGDPAVAAAAATAVRGWRFRPARLRGRPVYAAADWDLPAAP